MSGFSSPFRPGLPDGWDRMSTPSLWSDVQTSVSIRTTDCFRIKTQCRVEDLQPHRSAAPEGCTRSTEAEDQLLQENGYFMLRSLAEDVGKDLDAVLEAILRVLARRRQSAARVVLGIHTPRIEDAKAGHVRFW